MFKEINEQLSNRGLLIKNGHASIIDASVVQAKNNRRKKNAAGENTQDPEASYNTKKSSDGRQKTTYGFKAHINTDEDGFILAETLTIGKVHDSQVFEELLTCEEAAVYADSAYKSKAHAVKHAKKCPHIMKIDEKIQNNLKKWLYCLLSKNFRCFCKALYNTILCNKLTQTKKPNHKEQSFALYDWNAHFYTINKAEKISRQ